jgi:hypothetical protein
VNAGEEGEPTELVAITPDDSRLRGPVQVTPTPVDPKLQHLPTDQMRWEDFERLLLRTAREVRGLRSLSLFGKLGQAQDGLDVVGISPRNTNEGLQGKRYQAFSVADLDAAVAKFTEGSVPFELEYFFVGTACAAQDREIVERLLVLNELHSPLKIELWDRARLSEMLRSHPDIVVEFFGTSTAERFCVPYVLSPIEVPRPEAVSLADAVLLGPASTGKAKTHLAAAADARSKNNPTAALGFIRQAQDALADAGFPAHAAALDEDAIELLGQLGRSTEAARLLLDRI